MYLGTVFECFTAFEICTLPDAHSVRNEKNLKNM